MTQLRTMGGCAIIALAISTFVDVASPRSLNITSQSSVVSLGAYLSLSCSTISLDLLEVNWIRNNIIVIRTRYTDNTTNATNNDNPFDLTTRLVSTSLAQHNLTLRTTAAGESVWRCSWEENISNDLTVHVVEYTTDVTSLSRTTATTVLQEDGRSVVPLVAVVASVMGTVVAVATVFGLCVRRKRQIAKRARVNLHSRRYISRSLPGYSTRRLNIPYTTGLYMYSTLPRGSYIDYSKHVYDALYVLDRGRARYLSADIPEYVGSSYEYPHVYVI